MWLFTVFYAFISLCYAGTFEDLCRKPPRFGKGVLKGTECEVKHLIETDNKREALSVCETNSPFDVKSYQNGTETSCTYIKGYTCNEDKSINEYLVNDRCFALESFDAFNPNGCSNNRKLHIIQSKWELKWISIIIGTNNEAVWISDESKDWLKPVIPKKYAGTNSSELKMVVLLQATINTSPGTASYARNNETYPHLCSRPAIAFDATVKDIFDTMKHFRFSGGVTTDNTGRQRAFSVIPLMLPIKTSNKIPDVVELHSSCRLFPNGYAASLNDLQDVQKFGTFRQNLAPGLYRATGGRMVYVESTPYENCQRSADYLPNRRYWSYVSTKNTSHIISNPHWSESHPTSTCADVPRTTLAISSLYVDIPAIARRSVLCTYGNPPDLPPLDPNDQCNRAARFDSKKKHCVCKNPMSDATKKDPQKYQHVSEGMICIDCDYTTSLTSIVFILDDSGSVGESKWTQQERFLQNILKKVGNARVGVVVLASDSYVAVSMDSANNNKGGIEKWIEAKEWGNHYTGTGLALYEARVMLEREQAKKKFIVMFSDGDKDYCDDGCSWYARERQRAHNFRDEADEIHRRNIEVIYVQFPYAYGSSYEWKEELNNNVWHITRKSSNIIKAENFEFTDDHVKRITSEICKIEK